MSETHTHIPTLEHTAMVIPLATNPDIAKLRPPTREAGIVMFRKDTLGETITREDLDTIAQKSLFIAAGLERAAETDPDAAYWLLKQIQDALDTESFKTLCEIDEHISRFYPLFPPIPEEAYSY